MIYKQIHVGKTMENKPPMTGNGEHTTNLWWLLGDGLWHCFTHITVYVISIVLWWLCYII